jgi:cytochrome c oxidase subunit 2
MRVMWNFPLFPEQGSNLARRVDALYFFEIGVAGFFTVLVCAFILTFAVRYRRGAKVNRDNPPTSSLLLEILWIAGPLLVGLVMFAWGTILYFDAYLAPSGALEISVVAKQWMWYIQHANGRAEINELHVPLGRPVKLTMTSQDVIHSFYMPVFRVKQDVLPGRETSIWFQPNRAGRYHLYCAEYCGTYHSAMGGWVEVMEPPRFERWLAKGSIGPSMAEEGGRLFVAHYCSGCHRDSQTVRAPRLEGIYGRPVPIQDGRDIRFVVADTTYLRDSILRPKAQVVAGYDPVMPSFEGRIGEADLLRIVAYIKSIGGEASR